MKESAHDPDERNFVHEPDGRNFCVVDAALPVPNLLHQSMDTNEGYQSMDTKARQSLQLDEALSHLVPPSE